MEFDGVGAELAGAAGVSRVVETAGFATLTEGAGAGGLAELAELGVFF
ncbi:MAG: hypothetical protein MUC98_19260 [Desulfobacterota bacterium]|nr:hypothetical protein [Thermodesulfobacteriota bacterium]